MTDSNRPPYDALLSVVMPVRCNLRCEYCIARSWELSDGDARINIPDFLGVLKRTGKTFVVWWCGKGEPFLIPNIVDAAVAVAEDHYVGFTTNLTPPEVGDFIRRIDPSRVLYIVASLHVKELERLNLLDKFTKNYLDCVDHGIGVSAYIIGYPALLGETDRWREYFRDRGIKISYEPYIGEYEGRQYPEAYSQQEREAFGIDEASIGIFHAKGELCIAGYNTCSSDTDGTVYPCWCVKKKIGHIYGDIEFLDEPMTCPVDFCTCPVKMWHKHLLDDAMSAMKPHNRLARKAARFLTGK